MIAWLRGTCRFIEEDHAVLDVGGVGYHVAMTQRDLQDLGVGEVVELLVHTVVREDALNLYGFRTRAGREMFRTILSISGVGPRGAMSLLSTLSPAEIARAIHDDQPKPLTRAKGIGKRTAELIVVRLRERIPVELLNEAIELPAEPAPLEDSPQIRKARAALASLGYRPSAADAALARAVEDVGSGDLDALLRSALRLLRRP